MERWQALCRLPWLVGRVSMDDDGRHGVFGVASVVGAVETVVSDGGHFLTPSVLLSLDLQLPSMNVLGTSGED